MGTVKARKTSSRDSNRTHSGTRSKRTPNTHVPSLQLDPVVHERLRLGMLAVLARNSALSFNELKNILDTTDGNLSVHARKLEEVGYVACSKSFEGRLPKTEYHISTAGRRALDRYFTSMQDINRYAHGR